MKKVALVLSALFIGTALADSTPTSVGYVDSQIGALQNKISAVDTNTVLTHTNTAGEIGQKSIYDATGNYVEQQNALVTAEVANAAVQNAIDTEFVCIEWLGDERTNENCLIYTVRNTTPNRIVPTGYTALEYIESTGEQYIDTGIIPGTTYSMELDFQATKAQSLIFAGTRVGSSDTGAFTINSGNANTLFFVAFGSNNGGIGFSGNMVVSSFDTNRHKINLSRHGWIFDGTEHVYNFGSLNSMTSIYLFACNNKDSVQLASFVRIYNAKIWDNDTLVGMYIPARRDSDGKLGMYDLVSGTFFTNSGTGEFIAGPELNVYIPSGN